MKRGKSVPPAVSYLVSPATSQLLQSSVTSHLNHFTSNSALNITKLSSSYLQYTQLEEVSKCASPWPKNPGLVCGNPMRVQATLYINILQHLWLCQSQSKSHTEISIQHCTSALGNSLYLINAFGLLMEYRASTTVLQCMGFCATFLTASHVVPVVFNPGVPDKIWNIPN